MKDGQPCEGGQEQQRSGEQRASRPIALKTCQKSHKEEPAGAGASQEEYEELLQRLRDIEGEAEELRAIIDDLSTKTCKNEQRESSARGELEKALGLREEDVTEIMAAGGFSTVLDGSPLVPRANTKNLLQEVKQRSDDVTLV